MSATMAGSAQTFVVNPNVMSATEQSAAAAAQPRTASATAYKWCLGDGEFGGLGNKSAGTFNVAVRVPGSSYLKGGKAVSVNLPVTYPGMTNVKVWGRKNLTTTQNLFSATVANGSLTKGFNEIMLDEPYVLDGDFYLGYTFTVPSATTSEAQYPIGVYNQKATEGLFLDLGTGFSDCSEMGYGVSALQLFVEDLEIADYGAVFGHNALVNTLPGSNASFDANVIQYGLNRISKIEYTVTVNGETETRTSVVNVSGLGNSAKLKVNYTSPAEVAPYTVDLCITKINGQDNQKAQTTQVRCENVSRLAKHKVLVEEYTGTGCGYCPRGWVGMEAVKADLSDVCVPIAVHQYNSSDPMVILDYAYLPIPGAPGVLINRVESVDPYYGSSNPSVAFGIKDDINSHVNDIAAVDILKVSGRYNEEQTAVQAKADLEFLGSLGSYNVEFVLTADSLSGTSSSWRQTNYYYQYTPGQASVVASQEPELASFCKGGSRGKSAVFLTFNDVAISASYANEENQVPALPLDFKAGDQVSPEYTLTMPTKTTLKNAIHKDLVFVNVLVFDENGICINAARSRVLAQDEPEGIEQIHTDVNPALARRYNLVGQAVGAGYKGFSVVNGKKQIVVE